MVIGSHDMENRTIQSIKPYSHNGKKHSAEQIRAIAESIKAFGFNQPIVIDSLGVIIVGHGRYEAAKLLGLEYVPTVFADLTEEKAIAYRLTDNKLNESEWDMKLVLEELKQLELTGFDLSLTGFDKNILLEIPEAPEKQSGQPVDKKRVKCPECDCEFTP